MDGFMTRFICKDEKLTEDYFYHSRKEAENHLNMFRGDDSGLYSSVEVIDLKSMERVTGLTQNDFKGKGNLKMAGNKNKSDMLSSIHGTVVGNRDANFRTILIAYGNPDLGQNPNEPLCDSLTVFSNTIEELTCEERKWIQRNVLGSGNFVCADVWDNRSGHENKVVGTLYYNGKFVAEAKNLQ